MDLVADATRFDDRVDAFCDKLIIKIVLDGIQLESDPMHCIGRRFREFAKELKQFYLMKFVKEEITKAAFTQSGLCSEKMHNAIVRICSRNYPAIIASTR